MPHRQLFHFAGYGFADLKDPLQSHLCLGFRHVIGTLWEVQDELCVDMVRMTDEGMRERGMKDESVSWGLHKATRELRDRWVREMGEDGGSTRLSGKELERDGANSRGGTGDDKRNGNYRCRFMR
ncbi:hypothetical protein CEP53_008238 [Fusarium sp. AF-6]|nr:hypothetical protein CEP53_008238 [Fusarium sp. AF-6]